MHEEKVNRVRAFNCRLTVQQYVAIVVNLEEMNIQLATTTYYELEIPIEDLDICFKSFHHSFNLEYPQVWRFHSGLFFFK